MPYQQLHDELPINFPNSSLPQVRHGMQRRTVVRIVMVAVGLGLGLGSILTMAGLAKVEAANRILSTAVSDTTSMPPLPNIQVHGVSDSHRPTTDLALDGHTEDGNRQSDSAGFRHP
jgi:hypothetical protein